ncbi:CocE/NonD family hydrolase [Herbiconiux sp. CPCC 205763]|uniref:CocE/NonD family hydrolase n=1 Tax=Herbiconiux aconitum TaxID=2970913 RepID=A0ABT2GVV1_9MICO|nr:CocE/NonD family hydrolase [Herbiconiux aconitum]MCS5720342.1 CocE/NonD family hydrolase [Herbiconiux aconitum]
MAGVALAAAVVVPALSPAAASAATPGVDAISIVDGETAPVFDYADAIRERVFIPVAGVDQDLDGVDDVTAIEIIRPKESDSGLKVPSIIDASPYYSTVGRGNESELIADTDGDGINDEWPLFYDNYFVERGYAVILAEMDGTANSTGCPLQGGAGDIASMKVVIDWLQGRAAGHDAAGDPVTAAWHNGKAGMIGKSYDGTLANGVAATGVEGLTTIVPISAISNWYGYSRTGGIRHNTDYPSGLSNSITNPDRRDLCAPTRDEMSLVDGDETGDINAFWAERDYRTTTDKITASVFAVHGLNDDNVRMSQLGAYWTALGENDVPRKIWLSRLGHVDPFDYDRAEWVSTLHHWFDYWLQGIDNGIMTEPMATVESMQPGVMEDYATWPVPGSEDVGIHLAATPAGAAGTLQLATPTGPDELTFTGPANAPRENDLIAEPEGSQDARLTFLSQPLTSELRISGTASVELTAALSTDQSNLATMLVDYGTATVIPRSPGDGVADLDTSSCWGGESASDDACYGEVERRSADVEQFRVTRGVLDSSNRESLIDGQATPVVPGQDYAFSWPLEPYDHVFPVGHRIGVVVTTNLSGFVAGTPNATVNLDTAVSTIVLPIVGGAQAAVASGALGVPDASTVSFDLGGHGGAIEPQTIPYGQTATAPVDPTAEGYVFQGWFADAEHAVPFDFAAPVMSDTAVYASWMTVADAIRSLELEVSTTSVQQGGSVVVTATGFDADGGALGDVTEAVTFTSSVATDVIDGNTITFPHASPHVITATVRDVTASVTVEVIPAPVAPPTTDPGPGSGSGSGNGTGTGSGAATSNTGGLAATGAQLIIPLSVVLALLVVGAGALLAARRRRRSTTADDSGDSAL